MADQERGDARRLIGDLSPAESLGELNVRMGIEIVDWTPERMVATMPVEGNRQPYGLLHGGASCVGPT